MGLSKKRFFITLGLSIGVWLISTLVQLVFSQNNVQYGFFIFAKSCEVTGYPVAMCLPEHNKSMIYLIYLLNIFFWFWVIHLFWGFINKSSQQK